MRLSTNELRSRAAAFAADWRDAAYEKGETQSFYNAFFAIFGVDRRRVAVYERSVETIRGNRGFIDLFWPGELLVEQKSGGRDLFAAEGQALGYTHGLSDAELPKRILVCDFQTWKLTDLDTRETVTFPLADLPRHIDRFSFILGRQTVRFKDQDPVNVRASELVGLLHDLLEASGYTGHRLEVFLTRIVFCLFADDTGIFEPRDILWDYLDSETKPDGSDTGDRLGALFNVLNTPDHQRQKTLAPALAKFPYVNGHLFAEYFPPPAFDADMRAALLNACRFDWTPISPAIFGSLFQSVMDKAERRRKGAHYTTEKNILKLIGPLFLDDLRAEFDRLRALKTGRAQRLAAFHDKLASLTFFDPACGCGNFLIIAYRELRLLELDLLLDMRTDNQLNLDAAVLSRVDVDQFYGIELEEFPARIAETAMWMMDHLMNLRLSEAFGGYYPRIPLKKSPTIRHADALETDWADVLPPERCSYVLGNPPFVGAKYQGEVQRAQVRRVAALGKSGGTLDFVAAWFLKAGAYVARPVPATPAEPLPAPLSETERGRALLPPSPVGEGPGERGEAGPGNRRTPPRIAFVATNSITQGEQVAQLWPVLFDRYGLEIAFAHRTFEWGSDARGKAHVHVVIIGLTRQEDAPAGRRLFSYPDIRGEAVETVHRAISPYLFDAGGMTDPHTVVREEARPINGMPRLLTGSQPIDGGNYIFSKQEREAFLALEPQAEQVMRPFVGAEEFLNGSERWILALQDVPSRELAHMPNVRERMRLVRAFRSKSERKSTIHLANYPVKYNVEVIPTQSFLALPEVSSERRDCLPIAWLGPPTIPSNKIRILPDATLSDFALLTSAMHMAWMRAVTGRLESRYMYSVGVVYNTFPLPPTTNLTKLDPLAQAILDARAAHPGATLADLYDPDLMPPNLRSAHAALDRAVDRLYRPAGFGSDRERVEHLFALYEGMAAPLLAAGRRKKRRQGGAAAPKSPAAQTA
ncbi:MAG: class I SAM-dependent DNA methyltransferase [Rhodobacter sp.]|nr:class I SAM-dependent DNA methyltransferase [Rhodobacter sp.]